MEQLIAEFKLIQDKNRLLEDQITDEYQNR